MRSSKERGEDLSIFEIRRRRNQKKNKNTRLKPPQAEYTGSVRWGRGVEGVREGVGRAGPADL